MTTSYHAIITPLARRVYALLAEFDELRSLHSAIVTLLLSEGPRAVEQLHRALGSSHESDDAMHLEAFAKIVRAARVPTLSDRAETLGPIARALKARGARLRAPVEGGDPVVDADDACPADAVLEVVLRLARLVVEYRRLEGPLAAIGAVLSGRSREA